MRRAARLPGQPPFGHLIFDGRAIPCAIGARGITHAKREGDRATPAGAARLLFGYYRADRGPRPVCRVPLRPLHRAMGWCDEPVSPRYNRAITLPAKVGHEVLWRRDGLYDMVFVLDYNIHPRRTGRGSAIFFHCARSDLAPTLGCVALRPADMRRLVPRLTRGIALIVL